MFSFIHHIFNILSKIDSWPWLDVSLLRVDFTTLNTCWLGQSMSCWYAAILTSVSSWEELYSCNSTERWWKETTLSYWCETPRLLLYLSIPAHSSSNITSSILIFNIARRQKVRAGDNISAHVCVCLFVSKIYTLWILMKPECYYLICIYN